MNCNDDKENLFDKLYKIQKLLKKESALKELCKSHYLILKIFIFYSYKNI